MSNNGNYKILDCRARPNTPEYHSLLDGAAIKKVFEKSGNPLPPVGTLEEFIADLDEAGISKVVCTGRDIESTSAWKVTNDYVARIMNRYPDRIIGLAGIDPNKGPAAVTEVERAINELKLKGVSMDPFGANMYANDRRMYPIYQKCAELDVPVFITIGPLPVGGTYLSYGSPMPVDEVATDFPTLKIVCSHGGWPFTYEMIAIAFRHDNVYFETSVYHFLPGAKLIVEAANSILGDKVLFASAHPFAQLKPTVEKFTKLPFRDDVLRKVLWDNAARLFKLE
ncbi:MAG: amidohydrolase family protein [Thermoanaerobacterales bacterium]|nr:amidohydrolase family protein [Thermoanaerobacterales bacterium]